MTKRFSHTKAPFVKLYLFHVVQMTCKLQVYKFCRFEIVNKDPRDLSFPERSFWVLSASEVNWTKAIFLCFKCCQAMRTEHLQWQICFFLSLCHLLQPTDPEDDHQVLAWQVLDRSWSYFLYSCKSPQKLSV